MHRGQFGDSQGNIPSLSGHKGIKTPGVQIVAVLQAANESLVFFIMVKTIVPIQKQDRHIASTIG
jgi:hypothetical protein